MLAFVIKLTKK